MNGNVNGVNTNSSLGISPTGPVGMPVVTGSSSGVAQSGGGATAD